MGRGAQLSDVRDEAVQAHRDDLVPLPQASELLVLVVVWEGERVQESVVGNIPHLHRLVCRARDALGAVRAKREPVDPSAVRALGSAVELALAAAVLAVVDEGLAAGGSFETSA